MKFILIYTTHSNLAEAKKLAEQLLINRDIACVNYFPITSSYHWKGKVETTEETVALLKTRSEKWEKVKDFILQYHPYETPCVIKLAEVDSNESYANWIQTETAS